MRRDACGQQQGLKRLGRINRPLSGRMRMQAKEDLPVREAGAEAVGGVHRERGLSDPGHPIDRVDADDPTSRCLPANRGDQPVQLSGTPGERSRVARQRAQRHRWLHARHRGQSGQAFQYHLGHWVHLIGQADPAGRPGLLYRHLDRAISGRDAAVPYHLLEKPDEAITASTPGELARAAFTALASSSRNAKLTAVAVTPCWS